MTDTQTERLLDIACTTAERAGALLLERFGTPARGLDTKTSPTDWVSDADRDAETLIVERLSEQRPEDGLLGEEGSGRASHSGLTWVIDPLDGTVNFLYGIPIWCVSLACSDVHGPVVGVVHDPNRGETFTAARGEGAWLNGRRLRIGSTGELSQALIATGFSYDARVREAQAAGLARVLPEVRDVRRAGSAAIDMAWTACGRVDAFYEGRMEPWDRAAGELLVREAGGVVSDLYVSPDAPPGVVAGNRALHDAVRVLVG